MSKWLSSIGAALLSALVACQYETVTGSGAQGWSSDRWDPIDSGGGTDSFGSDDSGTDGTGVDGCEREEVDPFRELLVIDPSVLESEEASNAVDGAAFSFRSRMEELAGDATQAGDFTAAWLATWATTESVSGAPVGKRPDVTTKLLDPWKSRSSDGYGAFDMAQVPFRLIAIVNRPDLGGSACSDKTGELRFVYTAIDAAGAPLQMTAIVEVPYPAAPAGTSWAAKWHALRDIPFSGKFTQALASLTRSVMKDAVLPTVRVRTNEVSLGKSAKLPWEMREFEIDSSSPRVLTQHLLTATPRDSLLGSAQVDAWLIQNESKLAAGTVLDLPVAMQAAEASVPRSNFVWAATSVSDAAQSTFSAGTCNGCHGGERPNDTLLFQHLAPAGSASYFSGDSQGATRVSTFLYDPTDGSGDLVRRAKVLRTRLCTSCGGTKPPPTSGTTYGPCR